MDAVNVAAYEDDNERLFQLVTQFRDAVADPTNGPAVLSAIRVLQFVADGVPIDPDHVEMAQDACSSLSI